MQNFGELAQIEGGGQIKHLNNKWVREGFKKKIKNNYGKFHIGS